MKSVATSFTRYELLAEEEKNGHSLSSLNVAVIQNLLANIAEEKINLPFTPNNVLEFSQQEAYLKGQMDILRFLLQSNEESQQQHTIQEN